MNIETRVLAGGRIRFARFARVVGGGLEIGNMLCVADPLYGLPILGADLVSVAGRNHMLAADLSLTVPVGTERDRQLARLRATLSGARPLPPGGALPDWCRAWFSPFALYTRVGDDRVAEAIRTYRAYARTFVEMVRRAVAQPELVAHVARAQAGYARAHRTEDAGLRLLGRIFGEEWAQRFIREVLFPTDLAASG